MEIIYFLAGMLAGAGIIYTVIRILVAGKKATDQVKERFLQENLDNLKVELKTAEKEILRLTSDLSVSKTDGKNLLEKLSQQKEEIRILYEKMNIEFKNLANEILDEKTRKFTEQNKVNLDALLKPLSEKIKDFEKKVDDVYMEESRQRFSLKEEVKKLADLNLKVGEEAKNLTRALKGESKTQGNWGEMILESILEKSGLVKDRQYFVQSNVKDQEGKNLRPDIVVEYPGERFVIIDSKVSLVAYEKYFSSEDREIQEKALADHIQSVKNHIISLSKKNYQELYDVKTLDFVMLFMPIEPAYLVVVEKDPELWNFAYEKRILLMSPTNLIAALKMISSLWRQEFQNRNAREIAKKSSDLLDKFYGLLDDLVDIGNKLKAAQKSYDESMNKLSTGKGNLIKRARDIEALGAKPSKNIPGQIDAIEDNGEEQNLLSIGN
jgi:DNA recombination protein RmuC